MAAASKKRRANYAGWWRIFVVVMIMNISAV